MNLRNLLALAVLATAGCSSSSEPPPAGDATKTITPPAQAHLDVVTNTLDIGATYTPHGSGDDDYRCFIVDPGLATDAFLTAYEVKPGEARVVHHVILYSLTSPDGETQ